MIRNVIILALGILLSAQEIKINKTHIYDTFHEDFVRSYAKKVVIDNKRNLMWQDDADVRDKLVGWEDAYSYCKNLDLAGYLDWYLPTAGELQSIVDRKRMEPSLQVAFKYSATGSSNNDYWSSSLPTVNEVRKVPFDFPNKAHAPWRINFSKGWTSFVSFEPLAHIRCVRVTHAEEEKIVQTSKEKEIIMKSDEQISDKDIKELKTTRKRMMW